MITVTRDTTPPVVSLTSPANNLTVNTGSVLLSGTVDDPTVSNVNVTVTGQAPQTVPVHGGSFSRSINLGVTETDIVVTATDTVGNTSTAVTRTVTLDTDAPVVTITSPENGLVTDDALLVVTGTVVDVPPITEATLYLNGVAQTPAVTVDSDNFTYSVTLPQEENTIEVTATDGVNTGSSGTIMVTLDTTSPTLTVGLSDPTESVLITIGSNEPLQSPPTVNVNINGVDNGDVDMTLAGVNT